MSKNKIDKKPKKEKKPSDKLADKTNLEKFLQTIFGDAQKKTLKRLHKKVEEINSLEPKYKKMSDEELSDQTSILKEKLQKLTKKSEAEAAKKALAEEKSGKKSKNSRKSKNPNSLPTILFKERLMLFSPTLSPSVAKFPDVFLECVITTSSSSAEWFFTRVMSPK